MIPKAENTVLEIQKVDSIVLDSGEHLIGQFREEMQIGPEGKILSFTDLMNQQIYLFDSRGNLINIIGGMGSGPEEFRQIIAQTVDDERVIVVDESTLLLKVFSIEGELLNEARIFEDENLFIVWWDTFLEGDTIYLQIIETEKMNREYNSSVVAKIDLKSGELLDLAGRYDPVIETSNDQHHYQHFTLDENAELLYTSSNKFPSVQVFDLKSGNRVDYFKAAQIKQWKELKEKVKATMPRDEIRRIVTGTSYINGIEVTDRFILQSFQTLNNEWWQTKDFLAKDNFLSVYDKSGNTYYGTIPINGVVGDVHDNQLYIIEDTNPDNYTIGVYEIEITQ